MDRISATKMVDSGSITGQVKPKTELLKINTLYLAFINKKMDSVKSQPYVMDKRASGRLAQRPRGPFTVFWPRNFDGHHNG